MRKDYIPYLLSIIFITAAILGITLFAAFIYGVVAGTLDGMGLFRAPFFLRTVSDALFLAGGIILTFGALVEFFLKAHSYSITRRLMLPYTMAGRMASRSDAGQGPAALNDTSQKSYAGGWMLIFSGALLVIASLGFALISAK